MLLILKILKNIFSQSQLSHEEEKSKEIWISLNLRWQSCSSVRSLQSSTSSHRLISGMHSRLCRQLWLGSWNVYVECFVVLKECLFEYLLERWSEALIAVFFVRTIGTFRLAIATFICINAILACAFKFIFSTNAWKFPCNLQFKKEHWGLWDVKFENNNFD